VDPGSLYVQQSIDSNDWILLCSGVIGNSRLSQLVSCTASQFSSTTDMGSPSALAAPSRKRSHPGHGSPVQQAKRAAGRFLFALVCGAYCLLCVMTVSGYGFQMLLVVPVTYRLQAYNHDLMCSDIASYTPLLFHL